MEMYYTAVRQINFPDPFWRKWALCSRAKTKRTIHILISNKSKSQDLWLWSYINPLRESDLHFWDGRWDFKDKLTVWQHFSQWCSHIFQQSKTIFCTSQRHCWVRRRSRCWKGLSIVCKRILKWTTLYFCSAVVFAKECEKVKGNEQQKNNSNTWKI